MKVGLIGLGIMGLPMGVNLINAGVDLMVYNRTKEKAAKLLDMGAVFGSYEEIGEACDRVILMVTDGKVSKEILFGEHGLLTSLKAGSIVCDMSSVTPDDSRSCYEGCKAKGVGFIDAPVSGGEAGAIKGTMVIMAGGDEKDYEAFKPLFDILGSKSVLVGPSGAGSTSKLVNQIIVNNNLAIVAEAFTFARLCGVDPIKVFEAIRGGSAASFMLDDKLVKMMTRDFVPGGTIDIINKDITNVMNAAHSCGMPLPYTAQLYEILSMLRREGCGPEDHGAIVKYFETIAGMDLK